MNDQDRQAIESLFGRLGEVSRQAPSRDAEAERYISEAMRRQPGSAYYMAQTIVVQEAALVQAQERIAALEQQAQGQEGGFLSKLFGSSTPPARPRAAAPQRQPQPQPHPQGAWGPAPQRAGGGFLAGAAQTAVGVAGGMILADMLTDAFSGGVEDLAQAAEAAPEAIEQAAYEEGGFDDFEDV